MMEDLQKKIDASDHVVIEEGVYVTGPLFLHSNMTIELKKGAVLMAATDEACYKDIRTRVAGIEMDWYPAVLNLIGLHDVTITGEGEINGQGSYWYSKYWGMRKDYDAKGLRFACDYDCKRPRSLLVQDSSDVMIKNITFRDSGFWNLHVLYSKDIRIEEIEIHSENPDGPSTDGIDIDSSEHVTVERVKTWCNDDSICIKSGRDSDGIRIGRPCHDIRILDSEVNSGFGITIGSEVSGGVYDVTVSDIRFSGTDCGFRIKSSHPRKGYIRDIHVSGLHCRNVKYLFHMNLNWNPLYCTCVLPPDFRGEIPSHYRKLTEVTEGPDTMVSGITITDVTSDYSEDYHGISRIFHLEGFEEMPVSGIQLKNVEARAFEYGVISHVENLAMENCRFTVTGAPDSRNDSYDNR